MTLALDGPFDALGDPVRRTIVVLLAGTELSVGDIVRGVRASTSISQPAISQPAVSQHLAVLRRAGLVGVRPEGNRRIYSVDPAGVTEAVDWLTALLRPGTGVDRTLDALGTEVARGKRQRRRATMPGTEGDSRTG